MWQGREEETELEACPRRRAATCMLYKMEKGHTNLGDVERQRSESSATGRATDLNGKQRQYGCAMRIGDEAFVGLPQPQAQSRPRSAHQNDGLCGAVGTVCLLIAVGDL